MRTNERPVWKVMLMALSFSGVLSIGVAFIARLIVVALGLDLLLKFLG